MTSFDDQIAVTATGENDFTCSLTDDFTIVSGPNGGYLAAIVANAIVTRLGDPSRQLRSITLHYLSVPAIEPVDITVDITRSGRSVTFVEARMSQRDKPVIHALAALSVPWATTLEPWDRPLPADANAEGPRQARSGALPPKHLANYDVDFRMNEQLFSGGTEARSAAWIRTRDPRPTDALALVAIADALPPAVFVRADEPFAAPTVDLTIHLRAVVPLPTMAPEDAVFAEFRTHHVADGLAEEDGAIWAPDGTLLAQSRQLAITR